MLLVGVAGFIVLGAGVGVGGGAGGFFFLYEEIVNNVVLMMIVFRICFFLIGSTAKGVSSACLVWELNEIVCYFIVMFFVRLRG